MVKIIFPQASAMLISAYVELSDIRSPPRLVVARKGWLSLPACRDWTPLQFRTAFVAILDHAQRYSALHPWPSRSIAVSRLGQIFQTTPENPRLGKFPSAMVHWQNRVAVHGQGPPGQGDRIDLDVRHARQEIGRGLAGAAIDSGGYDASLCLDYLAHQTAIRVDTGRARAQLSRILPRVGRKLRDRVDGQGRVHRERSVPSTRWVTATRSLRRSNGTLRSRGTMTRLSTGVVRNV